MYLCQYFGCEKQKNLRGDASASQKGCFYVFVSVPPVFIHRTKISPTPPPHNHPQDCKLVQKMLAV